MKLLVLLLCFSSFAFAQISTEPPLPTENSEAVPVLVKPEESKFEEVVEEAKPLPGPTAEIEKDTSSKANRADSTGTVMLGYQLLTTWIPSKWTAGYTHLQ